jgi:serine/threonine protein kinase/tetratricopeptide (TPR) repeat protein
MLDRIGHYRVVRQIGRGGMGIVYEAIDERLQRAVAIKAILPTADPQMRVRMLREARTAAAVSHPHICQLYEIGEHEGEPYIAMELLEGQSLADRLEQGPIPPAEAITTIIDVLAAVDALHRRGIVHRDLKPSNVFLSTHGVKLLDFGLARPVAALDPAALETTALTLPGVLLGTPRYMAPEQARGAEIDARADLFAVGALLFEMLSGKPAFNGPSTVETLHAVLHEHPPALVGSLAIVDADRVIQRALMKNPADRFRTAEEMRTTLGECLARGGLSGTVSARATTRLMVLPFRMLRPDPAIEFLAFSLPDAITVSLSGLESLVVRSSLTASRYSVETIDLRALASEAGVDAVLTGSLLQASGLVRVSVQLVEVPSGTVLWSHAAQVPIDDMFEIQDTVCSAVVEALALPLSSREQRLLRRDVPASSEAYAHYLRANRLSASSAQWPAALEAYQRAVEADPSYAPAWARLGRCLRIMSKYGTTPEAAAMRVQADEALQRAFRINPDLSLAHHLYTHFEVDAGRGIDAMVRLLGRVRSCSSDPELYAGLVHACRYAGLLDASVAAYHRAIRLDPAIRTSVAHTFFMLGDYLRVIECDVDNPPYMTVLALYTLGRRSEALQMCNTVGTGSVANEHLLLVIDGLKALLEGRIGAGRSALAGLQSFTTFSDPEGLYLWAQIAAELGDTASTFDMLNRVVDTGFYATRGLEESPLFASVRSDSRYKEIIERAREGQHAAMRAFEDADGRRLLGLVIDTQ